MPVHYPILHIYNPDQPLQTQSLQKTTKQYIDPETVFPLIEFNLGTHIFIFTSKIYNMHISQKWKLLTLFAICGANLAFSSGFERPPLFRPTISLLGTYTYTKNFSHLNDGRFGIENRKASFGFEFTNKFYVEDQFFIKTGIRFNQFKKVVTAYNQVPEIYDYPNPFVWEQKYTGLTVPILLGMDFKTKNGKSGDFFFGVAPGILMNTYKKIDSNITKHRDPESTDVVYAELWDNETKLPNFFYLTADVGANFSPIRKIPGFTIGALCSFQFNKAQKSLHNGLVMVPSKGYDFLYELYNENRVMNFSVVFSYTFGKKIKTA